MHKKKSALLIAKALKLQVAGRIEEAARIYREILAAQPQNAEAMHFLGVIVHAQGRLDEAVGLIRDSLRLEPNNAQALNNLGNVLKDQGRLDDALTFYQAALAVAPNYPLVHSNLGNVLKELHELDQAAACYRRSLELDPRSYAAHYNLGTVFEGQGKPLEAVECYRRAHALNPKSDQVLTSLGSALRESGKCYEALDYLKKAVEINPKSEAAHINRGAVLKDLGKLKEAIECLWRALEINPGSHLAFACMGSALKDGGCLEEAIVFLNKALAISPDSIIALRTLAATLTDLGRSEEAMMLHRRAVALQPESAIALASLIFELNYLPQADPEMLFTEHQRFGRQFCDPLTRQAAPHENSPEPGRRLRVGFVSGDFRLHPVSYFVEPILATHNRDEFEFFCYSNYPESDAVTARMKQQAEHWREVVGTTDDELAAAIRRDQIDILVDLAGHTANNRVFAFARKPAPVQVTMIGYMQTTGLAAMDYRITDAILDPVGVSDRYSTEELVRIPAGAWPFQPPADCPPVNELPALKNGYVTFASFNRLAKVTPQVRETWAKILHEVPTSRLIVIGQAGNTFAANLQALGIAPERIEVINRQPLREFLELHHRADLLLDTFPHNGGATTLLAAWMGVPFITLSSRTTLGRMGEGLLKSIGLPHLVATDTTQYVEKAVAAARDCPQIAEWRKTARERLAPYFNDGSVYTAQLEAEFRKMWQRWCAGQKAQAQAAA